MNESFSRRQGYRNLPAAPIIVREDAPAELRAVIVQIAYDSGFRPSGLRPVVCRTLRKRENKEQNWGEFPNIDNEIRSLIDRCEWYQVYDIVEAIAATAQNAGSETYEKFTAEVNDYFVEQGIGWKLVDGLIEVRGPEIFEQSVTQAVTHLDASGFSTATRELHEALMDLSRRPSPDITGAIQHSMAALECVARAATGDEKATLGETIKKYRDLIPKPLDEAVSRMWGFASENARHLSEGRAPTFDEAELVVGLVATLCTYLTKKHNLAGAI